MTFFEMQPLPTLDLQDGMFRAWWFDPFVATLSFTIFITWYWHFERQYGLSSVSQIQVPTSFRLDSMPVYTGVAYWGSIYVWRILVPPAAAVLPDGIPSNASQAAYLIAEVVTGIVAYDAIFFWIHWAMHAIPLLRHYVHKQHHDTSADGKLLECRDTLRHSFWDAASQVLVNIAVQRHTPWGAVKSRLARALHNVFVIWFLVESHTAAPVPYIWRRWFVGIREHRRHHLGPCEGESCFKMSSLLSSQSSCDHHHHYYYYGHNHRYQQFFGYLDDLRAFLIMQQQRRACQKQK